jgi:hypothetical protein
LAIGLTCAGNALAQAMSKAEFQSGKNSISSTYKAAKAACASLSGNARDICIVDAKGQEKTARAELDARYEPSRKHTYEAEVVKAHSAYTLAKEKCDDLAGNPKEVCISEAKALEVAAEADAKLRMKTQDAHAAANSTSTEAQVKANDKTAAARTEASADKSDAQYKVEKDKCDTFAGTAKDNCLAQAKVRFAK